MRQERVLGIEAVFSALPHPLPPQLGKFSLARPVTKVAAQYENVHARTLPSVWFNIPFYFQIFCIFFDCSSENYVIF